MELMTKEYAEDENSSNIKNTFTPSSSSRVIAHIDLDCFYCQVEMSLDPKLKGKPMAVVQYNPFGDLKSYAPEDDRTKNKGSIIAVSYEARAKGVKRIMRGAEAKTACPDIILIQVPTSNGKADLTIYRDASAKILTVLGERYPNIIIERASIDEVYLDLTSEASKYLSQSNMKNFLQDSILTLKETPTLIAGDDEKEVKMTKNDIRNGHSGQGDNCLEENESSCWFDRPSYSWSIDDLLLLAGALVVKQLRTDVYDKLGFTCSAGIASNKMLAKLSSGMHKPNKQTLVPSTAVFSLMSNLPFSRLQGFGGKLGAEINKRFGENSKTMGDLLKIPRNSLLQAFGVETTQWIIDRANGIDDDPVQNRALPISIGCSKSFRSSKILQPIHISDGTVLYWFHELSKELYQRMVQDTNLNQRKAKQLHVGFSVKFSEKGLIPDEIKRGLPKEGEWFESQGFSFSKVARLPTNFNVLNIAQVALSLLQKSLNENPRIQAALRNSDTQIWGITHLGLSVTQFESCCQGKSSILSFFQGNSGNNQTKDLSELNDTSQLLHLPQSITMDEVDEFLEFESVNEADDSLITICPLKNPLSLNLNLSLKNNIQPEESLFPCSSTLLPHKPQQIFEKNSPVNSKRLLQEPENNKKPLKRNFTPNIEKYLKNIDIEFYNSLPLEIQEEILQDQIIKYTSSSDNPTKNKNNSNQAKLSSRKITNWFIGK